MTFINTFSVFFSEKIRLDISCESFARQRIHIKLQALFSMKNKSKIKCRLLHFLFVASGRNGTGQNKSPLREKIGGGGGDESIVVFILFYFSVVYHMLKYRDV